MTHTTKTLPTKTLPMKTLPMKIPTKTHKHSTTHTHEETSNQTWAVHHPYPWRHKPSDISSPWPIPTSHKQSDISSPRPIPMTSQALAHLPMTSRCRISWRENGGPCPSLGFVGLTLRVSNICASSRSWHARFRLNSISCDLRNAGMRPHGVTEETGRQGA